MVLVLCSTLFAHVVQRRTESYPSARVGIAHDHFSKLIYWGILLAFILFSGLRQKYNDTTTYMYGFKIFDPSEVRFSTLFESYGGFAVYQKLIKTYISDDPQIFILISAIVTNLLYVPFYTRHTNHFSNMIYLYAIGSFVFGMAGIKQTIAIGISLYAIEKYLDRRYTKSILLLLLAATFHPYILCLICVPFLKNRAWDAKTLIVIVICVIAFTNLDRIFALLKVIGQDYSNEDFNNYTINPFRVMVEAIPVAISLVFARQINASGDHWLILGVNMRLISFVFVAMGLFANPIYFGRMASYFTALSAITIPEMLSVSFANSKNMKLFTLGYYVFFFAYFLLDMTKLGSISLSKDLFDQISLFELFQ